jgi:4-alpha-glucanotransferase
MAALRGLSELAKRYGLQTAYEDVSGKRRTASPEALKSILRVMGVPVETADDVREALEQTRNNLQNQLVEPVIVAWNGRLKEVPIQLRASDDGHPINTRLAIENGDTKERQWNIADVQPVTSTDQITIEAAYGSLRFDEKLPLGYHRLTVQIGDRSQETLIIAAPKKLDTGSLVSGERQWGVFVPMYALHDDAGWGAGSITEFDYFARWVRGHGGTMVAALPLLASFFENSWDISPYSPASRLFWNEFFIDLARIPELASNQMAMQMLGSPVLSQQITAQRAATTVQHRELMRWKRLVLETLADQFFEQPSARLADFESYRSHAPDLQAYASFRAVCERLGRPWMQWPEEYRDGNTGKIPEDPQDERARRYHLYAQWIAHDQFGEVAGAATAAGMTWYLDLPLGTHSDGYDVWRYRDAFALGASGGAPPDAFFTKGQSWGFPPLHPHKLRERHYDYFIQVIRHHLRQARLLRIDHVMGLHRLYWVPNGEPATQGVYVRYPAEEYYAILLLESHRHGASIIGENLGTVPSYVNRAMRQHGFGRLFVLQYEMHLPSSSGRTREPDPDEVASLNTHDMPPFATWWQGKDIDDRLDLGLLDETQAEAERADREKLRQSLIGLLREKGALTDENPDLPGVLKACLKWLGSSDARVMLINLEDLWLETLSQNVPGTVTERVNWQRKTRLSLNHFTQSDEIQDILRAVDQCRKGKTADPH